MILATSALEGVNQTIKVKSSHEVLPTMGMAESLEVQDGQWDAKMDKYHRRVWKEHQSFQSYVAGSKTVDDVWGRCESEIHRNMKQRKNYHVRPLDRYRIELVQRHDDVDSPVFCLECSDNTTCGPCSEISPIPRFRRIRTLTFHPLDLFGYNYEVTCSCPYYTTLGIPCHHFAVFCQVLPRHCIIHHHIEWHALYKTPMGSPELDACYKKKQGDLRHKITREEYDHIMGVAHQMNDESETYLFDSPSSLMFQRNAEGMLVYSRVASPNGISQDDTFMNRDIYAPEDETPESFAGVEMRQESSFPPGAVTPSPSRTAQSYMSPLLNGAHNTTQKILSLFHSVEELYKDMPAQLNRLSDGLVYFLEQAIDRRRVQMRLVEGVKRKSEQATGEIQEIQEGVDRVPRGSKRKVDDLFPATERALKSKRIRPAYEVSRKNVPPSRKTVLTIHSQSN